MFNRSGLGLPGLGVSPPEVVLYLISPTGSSLGGESICGLIWDNDAISGGGERHVLCLCNL